MDDRLSFRIVRAVVDAGMEEGVNGDEGLNEEGRGVVEEMG